MRLLDNATFVRKTQRKSAVLQTHITSTPRISHTQWYSMSLPESHYKLQSSWHRDPPFIHCVSPILLSRYSGQYYLEFSQSFLESAV